MNTILVIGGAGYIGAHLVRRLQLAGRRVLVFDDASTSDMASVTGVQVVRGNLADRAALEAVFARQRIDMVVHLGLREGYGSHSPTEPWRELTGAVNLLSTMRERDVSRLVFVSRLMRRPGERSIEEIFGEQCARFGVRVAVLRLPFVVGADRDSLFGDPRVGGAHLLRCALQVASGALPLVGLPADATAAQEYLHVADACDGLVRAMEKLELTRDPAVWSLGGACVAGMHDVVRAVEEHTGRVVRLGPSCGDLPAMRLDEREVAVSQAALGWVPGHCSLASLVEDAWRWERNRYFLNRQRDRIAPARAPLRAFA